MSVLLVLFTILTGGLYGFIQGMIMIKPGDYACVGWSGGVRDHVLFKWYHLIFGLLIIGVASWVVCMTLIIISLHFLNVVRFCLAIVGLLCLAWEASECLYPFARWASLKHNGQFYEHFVIGDLWSKKLYGGQVLISHGLRISCGLLLIHFGGF